MAFTPATPRRVPNRCPHALSGRAKVGWVEAERCPAFHRLSRDDPSCRERVRLADTRSPPSPPPQQSPYRTGTTTTAGCMVNMFSF
eukprot:gene19069-biopygen16023